MTQVLDALQTTDDDAAMVIAPLAKLNDLVKKVLELRTQKETEIEVNNPVVK